MKKLSNFKQFNEMAAYDEVMNVLDLIWILEQKPKDNVIVAINQEIFNKNSNSECYYLISDIEEILPPEGMKMRMENRNYNVSWKDNKYTFYTYNVEYKSDNLMGHTWVGDKVLPEEKKLPPHKTVGQLIELLKRVPNPEKALFFMPDHPVNYEKSAYDHCFAAPRGLGNYNISSYPLTKDGEIVSGQMGREEANMFMDEGSQGRYELIFEPE